MAGFLDVLDWQEISFKRCSWKVVLSVQVKTCARVSGFEIAAMNGIKKGVAPKHLRGEAWDEQA